MEQTISPTRYLVNDASVLAGIPNVYASIFQFEGQVSVFNYTDKMALKDLITEIYILLHQNRV